MAMKDGQNTFGGLFQKYKAVFADDLGTLKTATITLHVKPDTMPKFSNPGLYCMQFENW